MTLNVVAQSRALYNSFKIRGSERYKRNLILPVQLFERNRDLEVVSQHMEGCEDVGPLHHLTQRAPLQHLGTENVPGFLCQEANVH